MVNNNRIKEAEDKTVEKHRAEYVEEIVHQTGTQSALLAGFAFAGLTAITFDSTSSAALQVAFTIAASLATALEIIALFTSSILGSVAKMTTIEIHIFGHELLIAWLTYLVGLLAFIVALVLLAWIKIPPAGVPVTIIGMVTVFLLGYIYYGVFRHSRQVKV
ncbi:MAG: hypothetical protein Q8O04_12715 [Deltaproteobacteria bacterium]|nr:hypothetical protein [Deltaproteobacteria bacterium]